MDEPASEEQPPKSPERAEGEVMGWIVTGFALLLFFSILYIHNTADGFVSLRNGEEYRGAAILSRLERPMERARLRIERAKDRLRSRVRVLAAPFGSGETSPPHPQEEATASWNPQDR